ncbi:MAG: regulatory protein RecX [Pseudomonadota bacterium]
MAALRELLAQRGFEAAAVTEALQGLIDEKLLDDERYAAAFVRSHAGRGHGPRRLRQDLAQAGLPAVIIEQALAEGPDWHQLATELRRRRFGEGAPTEWPERAKQARFLQYRGFSTDHIRSALGSSGADDLPDDADP